MKKYISILLTMFLIPTLVNAETLTYDICESGCEYTNLSDVSTTINNISDLSNKDIIININSDMSGQLHIGSISNSIKSITINGNNQDFNNKSFNIIAKNIELNGCNNLYDVTTDNSEHVSINNSNIKILSYNSIDFNGQIMTDEINLSEVLNIDETSLNNLKMLNLIGNFKIRNMDFSNIILCNFAGTININSSKLNKVLNVPMAGNININIYNTEFNNLKYINITAEEEAELNEVDQYYDSFDSTILSKDIYDINVADYVGQYKSSTTVFFDKETKLKHSDKLDLTSYLDYYTEDKEIEYTIEDESIAKIENKELIALKEGSTKVTVTTDDGHVVYRINLVVEKESIPEKIDKMTIKVPITGSKLKLWVLIVGGILLGIVGICTSMLIKRKK